MPLHTLRLAGGLLARRPAAHGALVHAHRAETGALLALIYPRSPLIQFVHTDSEEGLRHRTETFWRFLPGTHLEIERFAARRARAHLGAEREGRGAALGRLAQRPRRKQLVRRQAVLSGLRFGDRGR